MGKLVWVLALGACSSNVAPPRSVAMQYEGPIRSRDVAEGNRIYLTLCSACHRGRVNPRGYNWSPGQMRQQIREGNRLMPPVLPSLLSDEQVEAVLAYLSVTGAIDGELPPEPEPEPEPPQPDPEPAIASGSAGAPEPDPEGEAETETEAEADGEAEAEAEVESATETGSETETDAEGEDSESEPDDTGAALDAPGSS